MYQARRLLQYHVNDTENIIDLVHNFWDPRENLNMTKTECQGRTNLFAAVRGDKTTMRPFVKILWPLFIINIINLLLLLSRIVWYVTCVETSSKI